jgi:hypothetical protein
MTPVIYLFPKQAVPLLHEGTPYIVIRPWGFPIRVVPVTALRTA